METARLELQARLDAQKSLGDRNRLGQFATPPELARDILRLAASWWEPGRAVRFLDPAFGTGAFYSALLETFPHVEAARGYELDPHYGEPARALWSLDLRLADFTREPVAFRANLLVCNPPYVRHHHLEAADKLRLCRKTGLSGLAGLYCHFLLLAHDWLEDDGLGLWLIPAEFLSVNYGRAVLDYLQRRVTLLRVHRFDPADVQFGDALVSSAVVVFRKATPPPGHLIELTRGGSLTAPAELRRVSELGRAASSDARLGDLFRIRRGLATGANRFFVLNPAQVRRHQLPREVLTPILPSPRYLPGEIVEADEHGDPRVERRLFLVNSRLPEGEQPAALRRYLQAGERAGVSQGYLCRHRTPWYAQEHRPPAPLLCTYMGRSGFRFVLNRSRATAANVWLLLYPKDPGLDVEALWRGLNALPPEVFRDHGRVYGGGLYKLEPGELAAIPIIS